MSSKDILAAKGYIDWPTFEQILDMDDSKTEREFSRTIVFEFFSQAEETFKKMDESIAKENLLQLSQLGHFLKGSSATLGFTTIQNLCEHIQHLGARLDEEGNTPTEPVSDKTYVTKIQIKLETMRKDYDQVKKFMGRFYSPS